MTTNQSNASWVHIWRGLLVASLLLGLPLAARLLSPTYVSRSLASRLLGILIGLAVVLYANAVPKALSPLLQMRCNPIVEQAVRRFVGWVLALGGAAYAAAWLFAPLERANLLAGSLLAAALLAAVARFAFAMTKAS